jgi:hypothetical protein
LNQRSDCHDLLALVPKLDSAGSIDRAMVQARFGERKKACLLVEFEIRAFSRMELEIWEPLRNANQMRNGKDREISRRPRKSTLRFDSNASAKRVLRNREQAVPGNVIDR